MNHLPIRLIAFAALASLALASCGDKNLYDPDFDKKQFTANFNKLVMDGQSIDPTQTWNTAVTTRVAVTPATSGTMKIYLGSPIGQSAAPLITVSNVRAGQLVECSVARPQTADMLYVAIYDDEGYVVERSVNIVGDVVSVNFSEPATRAAASAPRRAPDGLKPIFNFNNAAPKATAADFLADVPEGVQKLLTNAGSVNAYIDETFAGELNIWGAWNGSATTGGTLYIKGNCDFSDRRFYIAPNTNVYLLENATLTLRASDAANLQGGCHYRVAANAQIVADGELVLNNGMRISNRGTITVPKLSVNNTSVLYNENIVTVKGELSVENNNSVIVNDGTLTATRLHTAGSGHVQNNVSMTISGNTDIDSNNNTWINNGQYRTGNFYYTAGSCDVINNCKLTVDNLFRINLGDNDMNGFQNDADGGVVTRLFEAAGPCHIYLGNRTVFRVTETATMNITKDTYGIYGPATGDYAVFEAESIVSGASANQGFVANYFRHLVVATNSHFPFGYSDKSPQQQANGEVGNQPYYRLDTASGAKMAKAKNGAADINIAPTTCNPGYVPQGGGSDDDDDDDDDDEQEPTMYYFYAFEDLGVTDDFDFNDVVLAATAPVNGVSQIYAMAAGGTLPTAVKLGGEVICEEIHAAFNSNTSTMINTTGIFKSFVRIGQTQTTDPSNLPLSIVVTDTDKNSTEVSGPAQGEAPLMIRVAGNAQGKWFWVKERVSITEAYTGFGAWGANYVNGGGWDANPVLKKVVTY